MGNHSSLMLREDEIAAIQQETGFTPNQIERLYSRFTSLDKGDNGFLCREDFHRIPELAINPLGIFFIFVIYCCRSLFLKVHFKLQVIGS